MVNEFIQRVLLSNSNQWIIRQRVYNKYHKIYWKYKSRNNLLRVLGEWYVSDNINWQLRQNGLHHSYKKEPNSYYMKYQYDPVLDKKGKPTGKRKNRGLDIYARAVDENNNSYSIGIEIYNWKKYHSINDFIYKTRIRDKFTTYDKANRMIHIICMNKRNVPLIESRCSRDNIYIISLREHISPELIEDLMSKEQIRPQFENLQDIEDFNLNLQERFLRS